MEPRCASPVHREESVQWEGVAPLILSVRDALQVDAVVGDVAGDVEASSESASEW